MAMADRIVVLDKGRVQQFATPAEVYGLPANRFVAEFMGPCLFLPVAREAQNGTGAFWTRRPDGSRLQALAPPNRLLPTHGLGIVIRPEHLVLHPPEGGAAPEINRLAARLLARDFLGAAEELTLRLETGEEVVVRAPAGGVGAALEIGAPVALAVDPAHCLLVPEDMA